MSSPLDPVSDPAYWDELYEKKEDRWELGGPSPPLERWFAGQRLSDKRALVVGCGRGHEARLLASCGAEVVGLDLAERAIAEAERLTSPNGSVRFVRGDLFALRGKPAFFDLVVEHTCYCAIDPARRDEYVDAIADALLPGGKLVGVFYAHGRPGGPPFTTDDADLNQRFARRFTLLHQETPPDSIERRAGQERLRVYQVR